jgi:hypothetical protein
MAFLFLASTSRVATIHHQASLDFPDPLLRPQHRASPACRGLGPPPAGRFPGALPHLRYRIDWLTAILYIVSPLRPWHAATLLGPTPRLPPAAGSIPTGALRGPFDLMELDCVASGVVYECLAVGAHGDRIADL